MAVVIGAGRVSQGQFVIWPRQTALLPPHWGWDGWFPGPLGTAAPGVCKLAITIPGLPRLLRLCGFDGFRRDFRTARLAVAAPTINDQSRTLREQTECHLPLPTRSRSSSMEPISTRRRKLWASTSITSAC